MAISAQRRAELDSLIAKQKSSQLQQPQEGGFLSDVGSALGKRFEQAKQTAGDVWSGKINPIEGSLQYVGEAAGGLGDIVGSAVGAVVKTAPEPLKEQVSGLIQRGFEKNPVINIGKSGVEMYQDFAAKHPRAAKDLESIANIVAVVTTAGDIVSLKGATKGVESVVADATKATKPTGGAFKRVFTSLGGNTATESLASKGAAAANKAKGILGEVVESGKRTLAEVPGRIEANRAAMATTRQSLESLAPEAKSAVVNGVTPRDVSVITKLSPAEKDVAKEMVASAESGLDPADVVGKHVTSRLDAVEKIASEQGKELGDLTKGFKDARLSQDVVPATVKRLREVPGLQNVEVKPNGTLDLSRTSLASTLSKGDRQIVQSAFSDLFGKNAEQIHLLRQNLFEILGGKTKAGLALSDTADKAINAIRQGAADVLEATVPGYKALSKKNAELLDLKRRFNKFFRGVAGQEGDIRDARGAVLARRLTSNAPSAQELEGLFKDTEKILRKYGIKFDVNVHNVQEVLNAMERYFDITKDTGLAGQIKVGVNDLGSVTSAIIGKAKEFGGVTQDVTRAAFKKLLGL